MKIDEIAYINLPDSARLAYQFKGNKNGTPIVFLNGVLMNMSSWQNQLTAFTDACCLLHDFRGQLRSDKAFPKAINMHQHVEDLHFLLSRLGLKSFHIIATSYGGEVALLFALKHPEMVKSLSIITSVSYSDVLLKRHIKLWKELASLSPALLYDSVVALCYSAAFIEQNETHLEERKHLFPQLPNSFFAGFQLLCKCFLNLNIPSSDLKKISPPTQIIAAENDLLKPPHYSREIARHLPNGIYKEIKGAGHAVVVEAPEKVNELLKEFML